MAKTATREGPKGSEVASRNDNGLALAKSVATAMRRSSVGEENSNAATDRTAVTYVSDFASVHASQTGGRKKVTPIVKR